MTDAAIAERNGMGKTKIINFAEDIMIVGWSDHSPC
jgi:hypothetical protein